MDAEVWMWLLLPLFGTVGAALYSARRDHHKVEDLEGRVRNIELLEAARGGAESAGSNDPDPFDLASRVASNTQAIDGVEERLAGLEKKKR